MTVLANDSSNVPISSSPPPSSSSSSSSSLSPSLPLSWYEARQRLKSDLEDYIVYSKNSRQNTLRLQPQLRRQQRTQRTEANIANDYDDCHEKSMQDPFLVDNNSGGDGQDPDVDTGGGNDDDGLSKSNNKNRRSILFSSMGRFWFKWDLDFWIGCIGSCIALVVFASLATSSSSSRSSSSPTVERRFAISQLIGSILIMIGCMTNLWALLRYRYSASQGTDGSKRRMIARFLRNLQDDENKCSTTNGDVPSATNQTDGNGTLDSTLNGIDLVGTSLTDIYPVYRVSQSSPKTASPNQPRGSWSRIPTLLLVKGDRVALQVGDAVPCKCRAVQEEQQQDRAMPTFEIGDIITTKRCTGESVQRRIETLPRGKTTFEQQSNDLLRLCNDMRVFEVLETPLVPFLREADKESKSPQLLRQVQTVRVFLSIGGITMFLLSLIVMLGRSWNDLSASSTSTKSEFYYLLPTPFLVMLSCFAFMGPMYLICIESLGTARILASYHPVASRNNKSRADGSEKPNVDVLILRYFLATLSNRFSLQDLGRTLDKWLLRWNCFGAKRDSGGGSGLVRVPPASLYLLEKLGVATAFTLVDDELVCEPQAIPQQLLIPSGKGLKLLDLCPTYEEDSDDDDDGDTNDDVSSSMEFRRARQRSFDADFNYDSDSDSDDGQMKDHHHVPRRRKKRRKRLVRRAFNISSQKKGLQDEDNPDEEPDDDEVQFEDPTWWQQLPSLKCIGLGCLLVDPQNERKLLAQKTDVSAAHQPKDDGKSEFSHCKTELVNLVCEERRSKQLRALAKCIGFSTKPSYTGDRGDISPFLERLRMHVISASMVQSRLEIDTHERGSEDSRWWGLLRADSTSVIVQDQRSGAYQLLTVGDPKVVTRMCHEAWQGENSTILPLATQDRATILETSDNWKLADLDVEAFSYAPIPHTFEARCAGNPNTKVYLLDNDPRRDPLSPYPKDKGASAEWSLLSNQIFLGILGSLVIPREETQGLLGTLQDAGVRFVYFSPRNMRRQKEIASQMGIDVAWNCAISLRPLDKGEEDTHRMVSDYADWDVNAKLPHGIESVRRHLVDVDNVPLLVSLFTDVTKTSTMEMIDIFKEYHDTVIAVGLSHLPRNRKIFSSSDLAIGVDVLSECVRDRASAQELGYHAILPSEVAFATAISSHNCAFRLSGAASIEHMPTILAQGRASLNASISASVFVLSSSLSFALYSLFSLFSLSTAVPYVPLMGAFVVLQIILPLIAIPMAMTDSDQFCMGQVPPKNDLSISFGMREHNIFFVTATMKSVIPAILVQLLYLIAFGEFMIAFDSESLQLLCPSTQAYQPQQWTKVIRCSALRGYSGPARDMASVLSLAGLALCMIVGSSTFLYRVVSIREEPPWYRNNLWLFAVAVSLAILIVYIALNLEEGAFRSLPWYFSFLAFVVIPMISIASDEYLKRPERRVMDRAEKLRRLQFETRLGMWSPK